MKYVAGRVKARKVVQEVENFFQSFWADPVSVNADFIKKEGFVLTIHNDFSFVTTTTRQCSKDSETFIHNLLNDFVISYNKKFVFGFNQPSEHFCGPVSDYSLAPWQWVVPVARKHDDVHLLKIDKHSSAKFEDSWSTYFHYDEIHYPMNNLNEPYGIKFKGHSMDTGSFIRGAMQTVARNNVTRESFAEECAAYFCPRKMFNVKDYIKANQMGAMTTKPRIMEGIRTRQIPMAKLSDSFEVVPDWDSTHEYLRKFQVSNMEES